MDDYRSTLERELERLSPPRVPIDQLRRRRDRKHRDQRIRAGVLGLAIAIAVAWWGVDALRSSPVPAVSPEPPTADLGIFAPVAGWITYGDTTGIWAVDPAQRGDPDGQIQLSSKRGDPLSWSRDGSKLLVLREVPDTGNDLYVLNADGTWDRLKTHTNGYITGASFSPDGTEVVYPVWRTSGKAIYVVDVKSGTSRLVTDAVGYPYEPAFSPDGSQIAYFDGSGDHGNSLRVMNADGSDVRVLTGADYGHIDELAWSPDGSRLAFSLQDGGGLFIVGVDGSGLTELITQGENPAWSPDGSRISFQWRAGTSGQKLFHGEMVDVTYCPCGLGPLQIVTLDGGHIQWFGYAGSGPWDPSIRRATRSRRRIRRDTADPCRRIGGLVIEKGAHDEDPSAALARAGRRAHARSMHIGARDERSGSRGPGVERIGHDVTGRRTDPERRGFGLPDRGVRRHQRGAVSRKVAEKFQAALTDMSAFNGAGMSATVMTANGTWSGATGSADGVRDVRVDSQFGIASITKSVIAAQVMQMVEAGELSLDAPATDYLPANFDFDTNGATIRQLLDMYSGIPDRYGWNMERVMSTHRRRDWKLAEVLALVGAHRDPVDEEFVYADTNYTLLGLVIEHVRGRPLVSVLRHGVLRVDGTERLVYQPDETPTQPMAMPDGESRAALEKGGGYLHPFPMRARPVQRAPSRRTRPLWRTGGARSAPARSFRRPR